MSCATSTVRTESSADSTFSSEMFSVSFMLVLMMLADEEVPGGAKLDSVGVGEAGPGSGGECCKTVGDDIDGISCVEELGSVEGAAKVGGGGVKFSENGADVDACKAFESVPCG